MAENKSEEKAKKQEERQQKRQARFSSTKILDCVAYFAIIFIAIALILRLIFQGKNIELEKSFQAIGECLAYIICLWLGFYWTMKQRGAHWNKRNIWWLICYLIAAVVIIIIYILAMV